LQKTEKFLSPSALARSRVTAVEGAVVSKGQILYKLDPVKYDAAYRSALARLDNAKRTVARLEPLVPKHAVAQQIELLLSACRSWQPELRQHRRSWTGSQHRIGNFERGLHLCRQNARVRLTHRILQAQERETVHWLVHSRSVVDR